MDKKRYWCLSKTLISHGLKKFLETYHVSEIIEDGLAVLFLGVDVMYHVITFAVFRLFVFLLLCPLWSSDS